MTVERTAPLFVAAPHGAEPSESIRLRTLVFIRWIAILGQAATVLGVHYGFGLTLPILWALAAIAASAVVNLFVSLGKPPGTRLTPAAATMHLGYDIVQLTALLALTGGLTNPFAIMILAPVIVSATVLPRNATIALGSLTGCGLTFMAFVHLPVPLGEAFDPPVLYIAGIWEALILAILFISIYVGSVAEEARRMSDALSATQMALAREQRLSALGSLAAAAAHELGSPLSTIAVTAREMARDVPEDSPLAADVELIISQSERCREILAGLAHRPEAGDAPPSERLPVSGIVEAAASPHRDGAVSLIVDCAPEHAGDDGEEEPAPEPMVERNAAIVHGLGNLIQNAIQHARADVVVTVRWSAARVSALIADDGPGFSPAVRDRLGEPYVSHDGGRREPGGDHMGLGIFIAQTLLRGAGARLRFANRPGGGAEVSVIWDRRDLEPEAP